MLDPKWIPVVLVGGSVLLKTTMTVLDKSGALEKLPPWARPQVSAAFAGLGGLLLALSGGADPQSAILVALGAGYVSDKVHATAKALRK